MIIVNNNNQIQIQEFIKELLICYDSFIQNNNTLPNRLKALLSQLKDKESQNLEFKEKYCLDYAGYVQVVQNGEIIIDDMPRRLQFSWRFNNQNHEEFFTDVCDEIIKQLEEND